MCGIAGFLDFGRRLTSEKQIDICQRMTDAIAHRGPDDMGIWVDANAGIALGHRRLSILDLSPLGHQPMLSETGRYVVSYNGEIYNFNQLRHELSGHVFRGRSDTEVLLSAFEEWGVEGSLNRLNGMFALAVWDARDRALILARDRFGEKPLYYGRIGEVLVFGSELKAIAKFPGFAREIDRNVLTQFLRFGYVPAPSCIFQGLKKLPAATSLRIAALQELNDEPLRYWDLQAVANEGVANPFDGSEDEAVAELDSVLRNAVALRMNSDVPLGAFLSGGIDSSIVVAMMQATSSAKARTFTIGFSEASHNEAESARSVAAYLGTQHTEMYISPKEAQAVLPRLPILYDEPFADSSQIPTFLVCQLARQHVTVALSGDGGDELFGGYNRYFWAESIWRRLRLVPPSVRARLVRALRYVRADSIDAAYRLIEPYLPQGARLRLPGRLIAKLSEVLGAHTADALYLGLLSTWKEPALVTGAAEAQHPILQGSLPELRDFTARMMCADTLTYLPDDILVKVDRAAMGVSLETRVPFLDPDVARFAWRIPERLKMRRGTGKVLLRQLLAKYLPRPLFERPKSGFDIPIDTWLRGPLREWAESQLSYERLRSDGFLRPAAVREKWDDLLAGRRNSQYPVWTVLMFQAWLSHWQASGAGPFEDASPVARTVVRSCGDARSATI